MGQANLTGRGDGVRVTINVADLAGAAGGTGGTGGTVQFPPRGAAVTTSFASVSFPPGVVAMSVPADGLLTLHVVAAADGLPSNQSVQYLAYAGSGAVLLRSVVEIGTEGGAVTFSMPVRISLEGQAGGRAFYIDGGAGGQIRPIDDACAADNTERVHRHLGGAGECWIDSDGGDMVIYTYHLTRFGTVASERGTPPPARHTCSLDLGSQRLEIGDARPGERSEPAEQVLINSGSAPFERVEIEASPWRTGGGSGAGNGSPQGAPSAPLPAAATEVSESGSGAGYAAVVEGAAVGRGLGGGDVAPLWFRLNLAAYDVEHGGTISQSVAYNALCVLP